MPENFMTAEEIREEFGLDPECLPLAGVRMVDHKAVSLFRESDAVKGEYADA